jgi:hypothetical protein
MPLLALMWLWLAYATFKEAWPSVKVPAFPTARTYIVWARGKVVMSAPRDSEIILVPQNCFNLLV